MSWLDGLTWTCHVCGDERPDAEIGVKKRPIEHVPGGTAQLRYCTDREQCAAAAARWQSEGTLLRSVRSRPWEVFRRCYARRYARRWERKHGRCVHPTPTYGEWRAMYGYRCARCHIPCEPVPWP